MTVPRTFSGFFLLKTLALRRSKISFVIFFHYSIIHLYRAVHLLSSQELHPLPLISSAASSLPPLHHAHGWAGTQCTTCHCTEWAESWPAAFIMLLALGSHHCRLHWTPLPCPAPHGGEGGEEETQGPQINPSQPWSVWICL